MTGRIRVVIHRVGTWVVMINRARGIIDNLLGLIIGDVDDVVVNRLDLNDAVIRGNLEGPADGKMRENDALSRFVGKPSEFHRNSIGPVFGDCPRIKSRYRL